MARSHEIYYVTAQLYSFNLPTKSSKIRKLYFISTSSPTFAARDSFQQKATTCWWLHCGHTDLIFFVILQMPFAPNHPMNLMPSWISGYLLILLIVVKPLSQTDVDSRQSDVVCTTRSIIRSFVSHVPVVCVNGYKYLQAVASCKPVLILACILYELFEFIPRHLGINYWHCIADRHCKVFQQ